MSEILRCRVLGCKFPDSTCSYKKLVENQSDHGGWQTPQLRHGPTYGPYFYKETWHRFTRNVLESRKREGCTDPDLIDFVIRITHQKEDDGQLF